MHVVHVAPEVAPYAKTGGLGDVLGALPSALAGAGIRTTVCLPGYRPALRTAGAPRELARVWAPVSGRSEPVALVAVDGAPVPTVLAVAPRYFDRDHLYGDGGSDYPDNAERFVVFCRAVLEWLRTWESPPDIVHVHDWQTALIPAFLRTGAYPELAALRTVVTVHNLAYQGRFWAADWHLLNLDRRLFTPDALEFYGSINFLKAGLVFADAITTVSPRYAAEIQTPRLGEGLDGVLRARAGVLRGILNGVDYAVWDPAADPALPARYNRRHRGNKTRCKTALQEELGLERSAAAPLAASVSRFAAQKGIDLLADAAWELLRTTDLQLAILGSGDPVLETVLMRLRDRFPGRVGLRIGFDDALAHRIEAGADLFLMPSRYEPCGLSQLYSLRYGTVPIVHATGGLADTVADYDTDPRRGTGFSFTPFTREALVTAVERALAVWRDPVRWDAIVRRGMSQDFSWDRAAVSYASLYEQLAASPA